VEYNFEYLVLDERYHDIGLDTDVIFATNQLDEAKRVANEVGVNSEVVQYDVETGWCEIVHDARTHASLSLAP
jgi:hypothetical protein